MDLKAKKIAVLGTGANGAGIGADLVRAGLDVTFIDQWPDNVEAIRHNQLQVVLKEKEHFKVEVNIIHLCQVAELKEKFDVVLLLMKAYDTAWACRLIAPYLNSDGFIVGVQNGMTGHEIVEAVGPERALAAVIEVTAAMYEPGVVERHSGHDRSWFAVGAPDSKASHHIPVAAEILKIAGVVEMVEDIDSPKWMKLILNAAELVPSAILDLSIVEAIEYKDMKTHMLAAGNEAVRAAEILNYKIRPIFGMSGDQASSPDTFVETVFDELAKNYILAHSKSTVLQDWIKRRHSEVNELNGLVVKALGSAGQASPANQAMVEFALDIENGTKTRGVHNYEHLVARILELRGE
ncbi:NAD(P)-binding domain-containing protein [Aquiluna sp.]|nr:2-dehydropantoate 2-reductase N-terminal domain-containing protein [Aquiluna sp.]MDA8927295.1 NAD(P)-binding domain-containing protein [Aquiluna sp.]